MQKVIVLLSFVLLSVIACRKEAGDKVHIVDAPRMLERTDSADDFFDATFEADETEGDSDDDVNYNADAASLMKILTVKSTDSLPITNPVTGKPQKYAKRQIISDSTTTRITLGGYGFKSRSDTSRVEALIYKRRDTISHACNIVSWSDTLIVLDLPKLEVATAINAVFSLKFKVLRSNDKLNKLAVSRVKSRASISSSFTKTLSTTALTCSTASASVYALSYRKNELGFADSPTNRYITDIPSHAVTLKVGDILVKSSATQTLPKSSVCVVTSINPTDSERGTVKYFTVRSPCTNSNIFYVTDFDFTKSTNNEQGFIVDGAVYNGLIIR